MASIRASSRALVHLFSTLALLSLAAGACDGYPLGIHFGEEYITAARYVQAGDTQAQAVASVRGSPAYRAFMAATVAEEREPIARRGAQYVTIRRGPAPPDPFDDDRATSVLGAAVSALRIAISRTSHRECAIGAFSAPQHFNGSCAAAAFAAVDAAEPFRTASWQSVRTNNAMRLAYQLNRCDAFPPMDDDDDDPCDMDEGMHRMILLHGQRERLDLTVVDVDEVGAFEYYYGRLYVPLDGRDPEETASRTRIAQQLRDMKDSVRFALDKRLRLDDAGGAALLRAVIIAGEAAAASLAMVRDVFLDELPGLRGWLHDTLDPRFVPAMGTAYWAKYFLDKYPDEAARFPPHHDEL